LTDPLRNNPGFEVSNSLWPANYEKGLRFFTAALCFFLTLFISKTLCESISELGLMGIVGWRKVPLPARTFPIILSQ
jgi:hypothetical protein